MHAILLGAVQGLTEFLPVSSSGHLVLFQHLFGWTEPNLLFDVCVHAGTLCAVILVFRKNIVRITSAALRYGAGIFRKDAGALDLKEDPDLRLALMIVLGSIPTAVIGLGMHRMADRIFSSVLLVGCMLMVTGVLLWATRRAQSEQSDIPLHFIRAALIVGIVQGMAILPGISRSGATIAACLFVGFSRQTAGHFSFLLSIPAILGATLLTFRDAARSGVGMDMGILAGMVSAFIIGWVALIILLNIVKQGRLHVFAPYCWLIGLIAVGWAIRS